MDIVRTLLGFVRPHLWALPVLVVLGLLTSLAEGIGIGMMIPLLDALLRGEQGAPSGWFVGVIRQYGAGFSAEARLALLVGTIFALIVLKGAIGYAYAALSSWFTNQINHKLRCAVFEQLLDVGYAYFARTTHGQLASTLERETWRTSQALVVLSRLVISVCSVAVLGTLLLLISWQMTLAVGVGVMLVALLVRLAVRRAERLGATVVEANAGLYGRMLQALVGMRVIRLFGREVYEQGRFDRASDRLRRGWLRIDLTEALVLPLTEILYALVFFGALVLAWSAGVEVPLLLAFIFLLYRLQPHIRNVDHGRVQLAKEVPAMAAVVSLLDRSDKPYIRSGAMPFRGLSEAVAFSGVSFRYDGAEENRPALAGISCEFRKNEVTAIVGGSGAGKSTLTNLLCRFYDPTEGEILIDGVPLRELDLSTWRSRLAFAGQDVELIGDTVLENLAYSRPDADQEAIIAAARQADAHGFIMSLPEGYDTRLGERGLRLSAGQRQRIGLARALLRNPDILILDEATNALDSFSERAIQRALERLAGRLTMVVIAHRLSTIRHADRVIVLSEGHVVEQGRPRELLRGEGVFARLWQLQVEAFDGAEPRAAAPVRPSAP